LQPLDCCADLDVWYLRIVYVEVHSTRDVFPIEVMDYQSNTKDRALGNILFPVAPLISEGPDKVTKPWIGTGKVSKNEQLKSDWKKPVKGKRLLEVFSASRSLA